MVDFGGLPVFANAKDTYPFAIPLISNSVGRRIHPRIEICKIPVSLEIQKT